MRILHILNSIYDRGNGIVSATIDLACEQAKLGHEVFVVSGGGEFINLLEKNFVNHITVNQKRTIPNLLKAMWAVSSILSKIKPDIVHAHMMTGLVLVYLQKWRHKITLLSTVHNEWQRSAIIMGLADRVIAVSSDVKKAMISRGVCEEKIFVVRNGTIGSIREKLDIPQRTLHHPNICTVAGLYHRKGISTLIKAFSQLKLRLPEAHLYIVGEGADREEFEKLAKELLLETVHFEGFQSQPKSYLDQCDLFVLASLKEPFGLVLSEARAAGCAVIGSNVGGIPEVLEHGRAGQLFPPEDDKGLAQIMVDTLADPKNLNYWREAAQHNLEWLSVDRVCRETIAVYCR